MIFTPQELERFVLHARRQAAGRRVQTGDRLDRAWVVARRLADLLRSKYRPSRILVFGSMVHPDCFGPESDIDLAVEGIGWPDYLRAWNEVEALSPDFKIDLIDLGIVSERMRNRIEAEGQAL